MKSRLFIFSTLLFLSSKVSSSSDEESKLIKAPEPLPGTAKPSVYPPKVPVSPPPYTKPVPVSPPPYTKPVPVSPPPYTKPVPVSPPPYTKPVTPPPYTKPVTPPPYTKPVPVTPPPYTKPVPVTPPPYTKPAPPPIPPALPPLAPPTPSLPIIIRTKADCIPGCDGRCKLHSRKRLCMRACMTCCDRCKCVPPGTYGNREMCGKCYTDMTTHGNRIKCP